MVSVVSTPGLAPVDTATARRIAADLATDLDVAADALRTRDREKAGEAATGSWLADLWSRIDASRGAEVDVATYEPERIRLRLEPGDGQGPPLVLATLHGTMRTTTYGAGEEPLRETPAARRRPHVRGCRAGRPVPRRRPSRRAADRDACCGHESLVHADRRREERRPRLPARRVPLHPSRRVPRRDRDDGRRSLLDRLRPGRLARPLRRQRVRRDGRRRVPGRRSFPEEPPLPERPRPVPGRDRRHGRRPGRSWERLRGRGPRWQRGHRPLRDDGGVRRGARRLRRAPLERRPWPVHGRRLARRDPKARVAHRRRRRRCRRRREARRVRVGLHGRQRPDSRLRVWLPC